jgi:site-specific DNA-methyltransferase (adenine-specific)
MGKQNPEWNGTAQGRAENSFKPEYDETTPATAEAKQWEGWGTALKPAWKPIIVARKPIEGTVAANVLRHGVGGINVDGCRVAHNEDLSVEREGNKLDTREQGWGFKGVSRGNQGRWPANLIHSGEAEVVECFPQNNHIEKRVAYDEQERSNGSFKTGFKKLTGTIYPDSGSAARFFQCCPIDDPEDESVRRIIYQAKASKADRDEGCETMEAKQQDESRKEGNPGGDNPRNRGVHQRNNFHPTVKATALMRYLCRLVTPPNGLILDPFAGSGSTGKAAVLEGFNFIGIEMDADYCAIVRARIAAAHNNKQGELKI